MCRYGETTYFAAPRRRDDSGWTAVAAGLRYEGFAPCGSKFRPRRASEVRARRGTGSLSARDPF